MNNRLTNKTQTPKASKSPRESYCCGATELAVSPQHQDAGLIPGSGILCRYSMALKCCGEAKKERKKKKTTTKTREYLHSFKVAQSFFLRKHQSNDINEKN